ncbi:HAMP domain-containing sensor histidine kinase [Iodidimonas sp. SYSU 1G8]|uniref:sensor histidine kinase n=1 Tax=Iodidimonas sp. SYSU 1G8 TaxID=3133967 RepID=UPI0031FF3DA5
MASRPQSATLQIARALVPLAVIATLVPFGVLFFELSRVYEEKAAREVAEELSTLRSVYSQEGPAGVDMLIRHRLRGPTRKHLLYLLEDGARYRVAGNITAWPSKTGSTFQWTVTELSRSTFSEPEVMGAAGSELPGRYRVLVAMPRSEWGVPTQIIFQAAGLGLAIALALTVVTGYAVSRFLQRHMSSIVETAEDILGGDLSRRVKVTYLPVEFSVVSASLNAMLSRIEDSMTTMRAVTDSIAHDFRSSLTRLGARLEMASGGRGGEQELRTAMRDAASEVDSMLHVLNSLLEIARAEAGVSGDQMVDMDLATLISDVGDLYVPVAEESGLRLNVHAAEPIQVRAHPELLAQAIANLIDNAIKYSPRGTAIELRASLGPLGPLIEVSDRGPGIPAEARERVIHRFVRLDAARKSPGSGLGLSLVAAVAKLHGAFLKLHDNLPGLTAVIQFVSKPRRKPPLSFLFRGARER